MEEISRMNEVTQTPICFKSYMGLPVCVNCGFKLRCVEGFSVARGPYKIK